MKQKLIDSTLYVFDVTPYEITEDTSAEIIKVQQEVVAGFKELNESLADKIVAYNYHVACVNTPEWAPYVDQDDSEPAGDTYSVLLSTELYDYVTLKINGETITGWDATGEITGVADNSVVDVYPTEDPSDYINTENDLTWDTDHWTATIDGQELSLSIEYAPEVTITLDAGNLTDENVTVKLNGDGTVLTGSYTCRKFDILEFYPLEDPTYYTASNMEWDDSEPGNEHWWYYVGITDDTIGLSYTEPVTGYTFTLTGNDIYQHCTVSFDGTAQEMTGEWTDVAPGTMITIVPTEAPGYYTINEQDIEWDNENNCWLVEMPEDDLTVTIDYVGDGGGESGGGES